MGIDVARVAPPAYLRGSIAAGDYQWDRLALSTTQPYEQLAGSSDMTVADWFMDRGDTTGFKNSKLEGQ